MPQLKKLSVLQGNILPKTEYNDTFDSYVNEQFQSSYFNMFVERESCRILASETESDGADSVSNRPRKRQRLDHLSQEEKVMRRKLKNRVAAQTARDRKKAKMTELEEQVIELETERKLLVMANLELQNKNDVLEKENAELKLRLGVQNGSIIKVEKEATDSVESKVSDESGSLEHASLINVPLQKEQDLRILTLWMMQFVYLPAIARLMTFLIYYSSVVKILCNATSVPLHQVEKPEHPVHQVQKWWGPHQKAWNPTKN